VLYPLDALARGDVSAALATARGGSPPGAGAGSIPDRFRFLRPDSYRASGAE
jgi:hypothetical protein